mgnify:FL=1
MSFQSLYDEGCRLYMKGRYVEAAAFFNKCLAKLPDNPDLLNALGSVREALGDLNQAAADLERACRLRPDSATFHYNFANLLRRKRERQRAKTEYLEAIRLNPDLAEAYHGLGSLCLEDSLLDSAESCLNRAVEIAPGFVLALHDLGILHQLRGRRDEAERLFRACLALDGQFVPALNSLGMLLLRSNRIDEASSSFLEALQHDPEYLQARANLAVLATWRGELEFAVDELYKVLASAPDDGDVHFNLSLALLTAGRMAEGFREHEWRFRKARPVEQRHGGILRWQGEALQGKRLLIHAEQGYGDPLQFIRYAGLLADRGAIVLVEAQDRIIAPLLATVPGVAMVFARGDAVPPVDYQIPMMSLPYALGGDGWPPSAPPYLFALPDKIAVWRERLHGLSGFKVGLAWAGRAEHENDANRSMPEHLLEPFRGLAGVSFVSLQVGHGNQELVPFSLYDPAGHLHDFSDSAALVSALDLVITVDSAVAHLAGGLGVPVWIMLPWNPDWRWQHGRSDSDWYPSARLFRQQVPGDWGMVIDSVAAELASWQRVNNIDPENQHTLMDCCLPGRSLLSQKNSWLDEESVLIKAFSDLCITSGYAVDIGAADGITMSNTVALFRNGWSGLAVEFNPGCFAKLANNYHGLRMVNLARCAVTPANVNKLLEAYGVPKTFDFLSLDIDGYDFYVLEQVLKNYRPKLVCTEINEKIPPPIKFSVRYDEKYIWAGDHFYGQSICQAYELCKKHNYGILELHYNNLFLMPMELMTAPALTVLEAYNGGYKDKADRKKKFPWNHDLEILHQLGDLEKMNYIAKKFHKYSGMFDLSV